MVPRRRRRSLPMSLDMPPICHLWLLRLLVPLGGHREFIDSDGFGNDTLAETLGLGHWIDPAPRDFDPKIVRTELRKLYQLGERKLRNAPTPVCLSGNVARLSKLVGLSESDCRILEFAVMIHNEQLLEDTADWLGALSSTKAFHSLSVLLDIPESEIRMSVELRLKLTH